MGRPEGSRNLQYEERRRSLLLKARDRLVLARESRASLRELAQACGVTMPTLRHYFPRREDLILAILAENLIDGAPHLAHVARPSGSFAASIREMLGYIAFGFTQGVGEVHTLGLTEGLRAPEVGPGFVDLVLEPSINAVRERLNGHIACGDMVSAETRHAALMLLSPIVLVMLHQRELGGAAAHSIDLDQFLDDQAAAFVSAFGARPSLSDDA